MFRGGKVAAGTAAVVIAVLMLSGCSTRSLRPTPSPVLKGVSPDAFLQSHKLQVTGNPERFNLVVPASWEVTLGDYPEGLYWGLANAFSKDAELDLTPLKGRSVEVRRYELAGGLPGDGEQAKFNYPSDAVLLVQNESVVGAWLTFNQQGIGPSIGKRNLQQITGLAFDDWVKREGYFAAAGANADLAKLGPAEVLGAWLQAISAGDKTRAYACLTAHQLQESLTMNLRKPGRLYSAGFSGDNSMVENLRKGRLLSYQMFDPENPAVTLTDVGDRTKVELAAELELTWTEKGLGGAPQQASYPRFARMTKGPYGWKLEGLGTGP